MSAAVLPIIKALAPHIAQIASSAIPAFTRKSETAKADPVVAGQIVELQAAVTNNAESVRVLAENIHQTIRGFEEAASKLQSQVALYKTLVIVSLSLSIVSTVTSVLILAR